MPAASPPLTRSESRASGVSENARRRQGPAASELRNALALDEALAGVLQAGGECGEDDDAAEGGERDQTAAAELPQPFFLRPADFAGGFASHAGLHCGVPWSGALTATGPPRAPDAGRAARFRRRRASCAARCRSRPTGRQALCIAHAPGDSVVG